MFDAFIHLTCVQASAARLAGQFVSGLCLRGAICPGDLWLQVRSGCLFVQNPCWSVVIDSSFVGDYTNFFLVIILYNNNPLEKSRKQLYMTSHKFSQCSKISNYRPGGKWIWNCWFYILQGSTLPGWDMAIPWNLSWWFYFFGVFPWLFRSQTHFSQFTPIPCALNGWKWMHAFFHPFLI